MKTTRYTLLAAALLLAASCANDPVEDIINPSVPGTALPGGTFVIDYTAGMEGADTRNGLEPNQRIQSLDYLIYQSTEDGTYTLLKKKSIPGIGPDTKWPLTRKDMTWEQREALKDTLSTDKNYKMVFVANADDDIWNPAGTSDFHALQNVVVDEKTGQVISSELKVGDKFNDGRLVLPPRVFKEKDMYYMWTGTVTPDDADENHTVKKEVLLQRMINKVEVKLDASYPTEEDIERYLDEYLAQGLAEGGSFYNSIKDKLNGLAELVGNTYTTFFGAQDNLQEYLSNTSQIDRIIGANNEDPQNKRNEFITSFKEQIYDIEQVYDKVKWNEVSKVKIEYQNEGYASLLKFDYTSEGNNGNNESISYEMDRTNSTFTFYTFGSNEANDILNKINIISFFKEGETDAFFTLSGETFPDKEVQGNQYIKVTCTPFKEISETKKATYSTTIDLEEFIDWDTVESGTGAALSGGFKETMVKALENQNTFTIDYPCNPVIEWIQTEPTNNQ